MFHNDAKLRQSRQRRIKNYRKIIAFLEIIAKLRLEKNIEVMYYTVSNQQQEQQQSQQMVLNVLVH